MYSSSATAIREFVSSPPLFTKLAEIAKATGNTTGFMVECSRCAAGRLAPAKGEMAPGPGSISIPG
jgi:hypothetical protein